MLSYRHAFHAGNVADVHKHVALVTLLRAMQRKEKAFTFVDTHAGAGSYLLDRAPGGRAEWRDGVGRVLAAAAADPDAVPDEVADWLALVDRADVQLAACSAPARERAPDGALRCYPGSPWLARAMLRGQDRALLMELHAAEAPLLQALFRGDRQVAVHAPRDAREGLPALLPPSTARGLVLIDPSYERAAEYDEVAQLIATAHRRWATAAIAVWYPLLGAPRRGRHARLLKAVARLGLGELAQSELRVRSDRQAGLCGSGLLVVNAPWPYPLRFPAVTAWLAAVLAESRE